MSNLTNHLSCVTNGQKNYQPELPKKRKRRHSGDSEQSHSQIELNLIHRKFKISYKKISSSVHNNSDKRRASDLPTSIYECYKLPIESQPKRDFMYLHLKSLTPKNEHAHKIFHYRVCLEDDPDYQEIPEELKLNLSSTRT